jgi:hypothetical protein
MQTSILKLSKAPAACMWTLQPCTNKRSPDALQLLLHLLLRLRPFNTSDALKNAAIHFFMEMLRKSGPGRAIVEKPFAAPHAAEPTSFVRAVVRP